MLNSLFIFLKSEIFLYLTIGLLLVFFVYAFRRILNCVRCKKNTHQVMCELADVTGEECVCQVKELAISESVAPFFFSEGLGCEIDKWVQEEGYLKSGITLAILAGDLNTNRTYLSKYINSNFGIPFTDWMSGLRIEAAKKIMLNNPRLSIADVSTMTGFVSNTHFSRVFLHIENEPPAKWRNSQILKSLG